MSETRMLRKLLARSGSRGLQGDGRLVVGRATTAVDDNPAVGQGDVRRLTGPDGCAAEHVGVEAAGALHVIRDDEVGQRDLIGGLAVFRHLVPP
jgi:hypothetical protein